MMVVVLVEIETLTGWYCRNSKKKKKKK